jgi:F-type H+-transporting ATPase subunit delta
VPAPDDLRRVFDTPTVPPAKKKAVLDAILARLGDVTPEVRRLLGLLGDRDRLGMIGDLAAAFATRVNEARREAPAEVVSAMPLDAADRSALSTALERATGHRVRLTERVDPALVGGLVARVGSRVFDGSVARQIERLRERLRSGA